MVIVSACLAGFATRYDGTDELNESIRQLVLAGKAIPLCPEQLGGLPTPRPAVEFERGDGNDVLQGKARALSVDTGEDFTETLIKGAREALKIALLYGAGEAILKDKSPSCGTTYVHSAGRKIPGQGITAALLQANGIKTLVANSNVAANSNEKKP
jgi:uncharacterized protein YbbK (DUF523 family)